MKKLVEDKLEHVNRKVLISRVYKNCKIVFNYLNFILVICAYDMVICIIKFLLQKIKFCV